MSDDESDEQVLRANANVDYMATQLADVFRGAMRAAAVSGHSPQTYDAAKAFKHLLELMKYAETFSLLRPVDN